MGYVFVLVKVNAGIVVLPVTDHMCGGVKGLLWELSV